MNSSTPPPPQKKPLSKISQPHPPAPLKNLNTPPPTTTHTKFNIPNPPPPPPTHTQNSTSPGLDTNSTTQIYIDPSTKKIKPRSYIIGNLYSVPPSQKY